MYYKLICQSCEKKAKGKGWESNQLTRTHSHCQGKVQMLVEYFVQPF